MRGRKSTFSIFIIGMKLNNLLWFCKQTVEMKKGFPYPEPNVATQIESLKMNEDPS